MDSNVVAFGEKRSYFSHATPEALRVLLDQALASTDPKVTFERLSHARKTWPDETDVHIAMYKFLFVQSHYRLAEKAVLQALFRATRQLGISRCYWTWQTDTTNWQSRQGPERLALFSLKALGVIRLRSQKVAAATRVLNHLAYLDPHNEIGGEAFREIAQSLAEAS